MQSSRTCRTPLKKAECESYITTALQFRGARFLMRAPGRTLAPRPSRVLPPF
jgi:hypothetical protein